MSFTTRTGATIDLDAVEAWTVRPLKRPADGTGIDDPDQVTLADWSIFPFEVAIGGAVQLYLIGTEARAFVQAQFAALTPWLR